MMHKQIIRILGIIIFIPILCFAVISENIVEKTYDFENYGNLRISTDEGSVTINVWDKEQVQIKMTMKTWGHTKDEADRSLEEMNVDIFKSANTLEIKERPIKKEKFNFFDVFDGEFWKEQRWRNSVIDFDLFVPEHINLKIGCDEGDVDISGINGKIKIVVDEGNINLKDIHSSDINLICDEGHIRVEDLTDIHNNGKMKLSVDEGNIIMNQCKVSEIRFIADEGDISIQKSVFESLDMITDEGSIDADFQPIKNGRYNFDTDEGSIVIVIPEHSNVGVKLKTDEGRISSDFDLEYVRMEEGEKMSGIIGNKDALLKVYASEGDIQLKKKIE